MFLWVLESLFGTALWIQSGTLQSIKNHLLLSNQGLGSLVICVFNFHSLNCLLWICCCVGPQYMMVVIFSLNKSYILCLGKIVTTGRFWARSWYAFVLWLAQAGEERQKLAKCHFMTFPSSPKAASCWTTAPRGHSDSWGSAGFWDTPFYAL